MYKVFHRQPLYPGLITDTPDPLPATRLDWPASYQEIAHVKATSLEEVYYKTQHRESPWWHNRVVKALRMSRSTSVGDVIRDDQDNLWAVALIGFVPLSQHKEEL